jgi:hypothetical protein
MRKQINAFLFADGMLVILGALISLSSVLLATHKSFGYDERTYWAVFTILGFMMMKFGITETRYDRQKQKELEDKEKNQSGKS